MYNDYKSSALSPNVGFCISNDNGLYIANNYIKGFLIKASNNTSKPYIKLLTFNDNYDIYIDEFDTNSEAFKIASKTIICKILDKLRYEIDNNILIDEIINEVLYGKK